MSINFTTKNSIDWTDSSGTTKNIDTEFESVNTELSLKANQATTLAGYGITDGVSMQFTDSSGAINYIGKNIGTLVINSGTHIFTNCIGTINYSGTTAKVFINNSPNMIINGKTAANWHNIYIDGMAQYELFSGNTTLTSEYQTFGTTNIQIDDEIIIFGTVSNIGAFSPLLLLKNLDLIYSFTLFNGTPSYLLMQISNGAIKLLHSGNPFSVTINTVIVRRYSK